MKIPAKKREVILLDSNTALDFVFCNTKVQSKRETLGSGHGCVGRCTILNDLKDSERTHDSKWLITWRVVISIAAISLFLTKQTLLYLIGESAKKAKWPHGFQPCIAYTFFFIVYISSHAWKRKQAKQCEYGFKAAWELSTLKYDWLGEKYMRQLRFLPLP